MPSVKEPKPRVPDGLKFKTSHRFHGGHDMTISVTIERNHETVSRQEFEKWPDGGLKGVLLDFLGKPEDGWYVVSATDDEYGVSPLSMHGFKLQKGRIYTFDMMYIEDDVLDVRSLDAETISTGTS